MLKLLMHSWEHRLSRKDKNRRTLPFDWGFEFLNHGFVASGDSHESISRFNRHAIENSADFFSHSPLDDYTVCGDELIFPSSVSTPYPENNTVYARVFRPRKRTSSKRAVVVLPQWNANQHSHVGLCRLFGRLGFTSVRLTLPYHEKRNPAGPRADFMVSSNIGRTIQAIQQSVQDTRRIVDWLQSQNFEQIGIVGTSVGSCISYLVFVHDKRIRVGVFNHVSSYFGDVVWTGISTQHVRRGIEGTRHAQNKI